MREHVKARLSFEVEGLERRTLLAAQWGAAAQLINLDEASRLYSSITGQGVAVALIDTGIDYNHPSLGGGFGKGFKVVAGWDFVDNDADPMDTNGHGTLVAGVVAANEFELGGLRYSGIAPGANLVALRVNSGTSGASDGVIEQALDWIIDNHKTYNIKAVNISLGAGNHTTPLTNATISDELKQLRDLGLIIVGASGNNGDSEQGNSGIAYPAADPSVVSVSSVNTSDTISAFAQRGSLLDIMAPGEGIVTTNRGGGYADVFGTSFAAPHVAGAAALLWQANPALSDEEVLSILRSSGPANKDGDTETGRPTGLSYPRLNLHYALRLLDRRKTSPSNIVGKTAGGSDIAYDDQGVLYLACYDTIAQSIRFATRGTDGQWSRVQSVDASGNDVGYYLSIAIDSTGKPGIAYFDSTNADLKYAHFNGAGWDVRTLDSAKHVGTFPSLDFDALNNPVIAYQRKTSADLRMFTTNASGAWVRTDVDTAGDVGAWADVSVAEGGIIAIAYADDTNGDLKYARLAEGGWTYFTVDDLGGVAYIDLNIHKGQAFISYQDLVTTDLKFAKREDARWFTETVYTPGNTGQFTNLLFDSRNRARIAFYSKSKQVIYEAIGTFGSAWRVKQVATGGTWLSAASTSDDDKLSWVSLNPTRKSLQFGELS